LARSVGNKVEKTFVKGLITEATGLNFPPNSCTDALNVIFDERGRTTRRLGVEFEQTPTFQTYDRSGGVTTEYYWENAGSTGLVNIIVLQIKNILYFYKELTTGTSDGYLGLSINLNTYAAGATTNIPLYNCSFTASEGKLFVAHLLCDPFYVTYNDTTPSVTGTIINIQTRDLIGDPADTNYNNPTVRPTATVGTVGSAHMYNLYNQGWAGNVRTIAPSTVNPVTFWDSVLTTIPSNGDIWWIYRDSTNLFDPVNYSDRHNLGSMLAPKGYYIMNPFSTNRSTQSGFSGVTEDTSGNIRPSAIAAYAGRIWYAGVNASGYSQKLYYSQVIVKGNEYGFCYQQDDPTSSEINDLLASDGGVIGLPNVGTIVKLFPMDNALLVFGTGGVYMVSGSRGIGFDPTDYSVSKVSSSPALSALSFVDVYGAPVWWNLDGIYTIPAGGLNTSSGSSKSLTDTTIKSYLGNIHSEMFKYVKGSFNRHTKCIQWLFRSTYTATLENCFEYDSALVYNIITGAFYPWTLPNANPTINGIVCSRSPLSGNFVTAVTDSGLNVVFNSGSQEIDTTNVGALNPTYYFRYLSTKKTGGATYSTTFAQVLNTTYLDWGKTESTIDYSSYFFTSYELDGDGLKFFQNNYVLVFADSGSSSSCFFQPWWEYSTSSTNARVGNPQQIYQNQNITFSTIEKRLKVRGKGRAVQFKFYSETGKPFSLVGWTIYSLINTAV
jgi:hypothetical protein